MFSELWQWIKGHLLWAYLPKKEKKNTVKHMLVDSLSSIMRYDLESFSVREGIKRVCSLHSLIKRRVKTNALNKKHRFSRNAWLTSHWVVPEIHSLSFLWLSIRLNDSHNGWWNFGLFRMVCKWVGTILPACR